MGELEKKTKISVMKNALEDCPEPVATQHIDLFTLEDWRNWQKQYAAWWAGKRLEGLEALREI